MSKLQQIVTYLESEKLDVAVVSDPVTINYLTGFYSDPHERQMFLFVLADQEPLYFGKKWEKMQGRRVKEQVKRTPTR